MTPVNSASLKITLKYNSNAIREGSAEFFPIFLADSFSAVSKSTFYSPMLTSFNFTYDFKFNSNPFLQPRLPNDDVDIGRNSAPGWVDGYEPQLDPYGAQVTQP